MGAGGTDSRFDSSRQPPHPGSAAAKRERMEAAAPEPGEISEESRFDIDDEHGNAALYRFGRP